jgi:hypothetical protein
MHTSKALLTAGSTTVAFLVLTGCSGAGFRAAPLTPQQTARAAIQFGPQLASSGNRLSNLVGPRGTIIYSHPTKTHSFMSPGAVGKPLIFVSDGYRTVNAYLQARPHEIVGWITGLNYPGQLATDNAGNLYVVTGIFGPPASVLVYAPPYTKAPKLTLGGYAYPFDVAVSPRGIVAVTGCITSSCPTQGVVLYAKHSVTPCATIVPDYNVYFVAFDDKGNLYVDGLNASNTAVISRIDGECNAKRAIALSTTNTIANPYTIQIDKANRIAIMDEGSSSSVIDTYKTPKGRSLGSPVSTTELQNLPYGISFAFATSGHSLWAGSFESGNVEDYLYPAGGAAVQTIPGGGASDGVAVTPPLAP